MGHPHDAFPATGGFGGWLHDGARTSPGGRRGRKSVFSLGVRPGEGLARVVVGGGQLGFSVDIEDGGVVGVQHRQGAHPVLLLQGRVKDFLETTPGVDVLVRNTRPGYQTKQNKTETMVVVEKRRK